MNRNTVQVFRWTDALTGKEYMWNIERAQKAMSKPDRKGEVMDFGWEDVYDALILNNQLAFLNREYAMTKNLRDDLILVKIKNKDGEWCHLVIDGWHRMLKFATERATKQATHKKLRGYVLSEDEEKECRIV